MRLLLDTNRYRDVVEREPGVTKRVEDSTSTWLSLITLGELRAGFALGSRRERNEARLRAMIDLQGIGVLELDEETTEFYGRVQTALRRAGTPIPTNDVWIAAQALQHNLLLDTRDEHFQKVPGLRLVEG